MTKPLAGKHILIVEDEPFSDRYWIRGYHHWGQTLHWLTMASTRWKKWSISRLI